MDECLFDKIVSGEIPSDRVYEDDTLVAFKDINPKAPVHVLIVPRKHLESVNEVGREDAAMLGHMFLVAKKIAEQTGIAGSGYRLVVNNGPDGGQEVPHLHMHVLGGRQMRALG
ncbi:MAG: histidine triad nucleotide-binding protein [Actinobacteria bacterium]|nr:MAG: histidine triad nucleotide-binding protein [Actinomycetota bacterium]